MARVKTAKQAAVKQKSKTTVSKEVSTSSKKDGTKEKAKKPTKSGDDSTNELKAEILALGGDEEDYELVKDVDSDIEPQAGPSSSKADVRTNFTSPRR